MGNQLVSSVKTVIKPIEYYLSEVPELKYKSSLGQTQFLKVALCLHSEGEVVVKVLSHEDPSLLLESYKHDLEAFALLTASNVSISAFRLVELRPNFAYIARQYFRYSLYDRLSTRPFLTNIEKYWIVYQLIKSMAWCHEKGIRHGDIKLENIFITSNLWVVVADFATFKPVSLPEDNPSVFNYFFDTSRRRCCNIAPERFVSINLNQNQQRDINNVDDKRAVANKDNQSNAGTSSNNTASTPPPQVNEASQLTDKMDMFSIGCILAEIFADRVLFDLSGLLYYKENKTDRVEPLIKQIENDTVQALVENLISLEPCTRKSCDQVLQELKGKLFPTYFDKLYVLMRSLIRLPPDAKILYFTQDIELYLSMIIDENPKGILLILSVLTSSLRSLQHVHCKLEAQRLICRLVKLANSVLSPYITDRLLPYFANILTDPEQRVRGEAINSITELLDQVSRVATSDNNIFTDYLMEILIKTILNEKSTYVRLCMARNVGRLSKIALNFLNQSCDNNYDEELNLLHNYFQNLVSHLLTDSNHCVRRALLLTPENCSYLCTFFGRQKTNEIILSHIITFLNDKSDFQLRLAFFDNIIIIASYMGVQCSPILYPLLQQGLCDSEEAIISKAIDSIAALVEQGLLQKNIIYELLHEILPMLYHPNQWIINSIVHLLTALSHHLSFVDLNCKIIPMLRPYLCRPIHSLSNKYLVVDSLTSRLTRVLYEAVLDAPNADTMESLFQILTYRHKIRMAQPCTGELEMNNPLFKRLLAENITELNEEQILRLRDLLYKIQRNRRNYAMNSKNDSDNNRKGNNYSSAINLKNYKFIRSIKFIDSFNLQNEVSTATNQEWQHMFGLNSRNSFTDPHQITLSEVQEAKEVDYSFFECPPHTRSIRQMLMHKKNHYTVVEPMQKVQMTAFRPRGYLVSHLQEHKSSVNQMVRYGNTTCFLSCSDDGTVRLWDIAGFADRYVINRSKFLFKMEFSNGSPINFKGLVCCGAHIITYTVEGMIYVFETNDSALVLVCSFKMGASKSSSTSVVITSLTALSTHLFAVSLTNSTIYGYDTRQIETRNFFVPVFKLRISPNQRTITAIDGCEVALFAGTAYGYIAGFDLRFNLRAIQFIYPGGSTRIARMKFTPEGLYTSVYNSSEVTLWDYKLGQRNKILSPACIRTNSPPDSRSLVVNGILPINTGSNISVITGGSDMRIRYWDLTDPEHSYVVNDPSFKACNYVIGKNAIDRITSNNSVGQPTSPQHYQQHQQYFDVYDITAAHNAPPVATYVAHQSNDRQVIEEIDGSAAFKDFQASHNCAIDQQFVHTAHHNSITDLLRVNGYLISSDRNGAVKLWK